MPDLRLLRRLLCLFAWVCLATACPKYVGTQAPGVETAEAEAVAREKRSVLLLYTIKSRDPASKSPVPGGTGFLVLRHGTVYLVTAQHVAATTRSDTVVVYFTDTAGTNAKTTLSTLVGAGTDPKWTENQGVFGDALRQEMTSKRTLELTLPEDVSVLRLSPPPGIKRLFEAAAIPDSDLQQDLRMPPSDSNLTVRGYPASETAPDSIALFNPSGKEIVGKLRQGKLNWEDSEVPVRSVTHFVMQLESPDGLSGSPVFCRNVGVRCGCVGIVSGKLPSKFTAVVPAAIILDTIARAEAQRN